MLAKCLEPAPILHGVLAVDDPLKVVHLLLKLDLQLRHLFL